MGRGSREHQIYVGQPMKIEELMMYYLDLAVAFCVGLIVMLWTCAWFPMLCRMPE